MAWRVLSGQLTFKIAYSPFDVMSTCESLGFIAVRNRLVRWLAMDCRIRRKRRMRKSLRLFQWILSAMPISRSQSERGCSKGIHRVKAKAMIHRRQDASRGIHSRGCIRKSGYIPFQPNSIQSYLNATSVVFQISTAPKYCSIDHWQRHRFVAGVELENHLEYARTCTGL